MAEVVIRRSAVITYLEDCRRQVGEGQPDRIRAAAELIADELGRCTALDLFKRTGMGLHFTLALEPPMTAVYRAACLGSTNTIDIGIPVWRLVLRFGVPPLPAEPWELAEIRPERG